jgi:hypothetical protein
MLDSLNRWFPDRKEKKQWKSERVIIENYDTIHPYAIWYPGYLLMETSDAWKVWHWWRHPITQWIAKNSIDFQVRKNDERLNEER